MMIRITLESRMGSVLIRTEGPFGLARQRELSEEGDSVVVESEGLDLISDGPAVIEIEQLEEDPEPEQSEIDVDPVPLKCQYCSETFELGADAFNQLRGHLFIEHRAEIAEQDLEQLEEAESDE